MAGRKSNKIAFGEYGSLRTAGDTAPSYIGAAGDTAPSPIGSAGDTGPSSSEPSWHRNQRRDRSIARAVYRHAGVQALTIGQAITLLHHGESRDTINQIYSWFGHKAINAAL